MSLNFEKMNNDGNSFLNDLSDVLGFPGEKQKAGRILKAVLHTMRDHIPVETSLHFLSQLPAFLKAAYVEEWKSGAHRRVHHVEEFLFQVVGNDNVTGTGELDTVEDAQDAVIKVFVMLRKYVSEGSLEKIADVLPAEMKSLLYPAITFPAL